MNKKLAFLLSCCAAAGFMACNETVDWTYTEKCEDGAEQCHENTVRRCVDGEWNEVEKCEGDKPVCDSTSHTCIAKPSLGCTTGETKCDGNKLVKCENAIWTDGVECTGDTPVCGKNASNVDDCIAKPSLGCTTGETKCDGNKLVKCENAIWTEGVECTGDTPICGKNESNVDACIAKPSLGCTTGETKCEGNKLFTCENAIWNEGVECTGDTPICGKNESNVDACIADTTVKCVNGDDEYEVGDGYCDEAGVAQVCGDDGEFEAATNCEGRICEVNENHVAACRDGKKCVVNEETEETVEHNALYCDTNGNVAKCDDGTGRVDTPCTAPEVCDSTSKTCKKPETGDCMHNGANLANGSTICSENGKLTCKDGNLSNVDKCTTDVENATAICTMVENVATCGYQCNEGYIEEGGKCMQIASYTTIKAIRADYDKYSDFFIMGASKTCGDKGKNETVGKAEVDVTGVVTGVRPNQYGFYIQDETGGIQVNCTDKTCVKYADGTDVAIGDEVNVKSDGVGQYFCDLQIRASENPLVVTKVADGKVKAPSELTEDDIAEIFVNKNPNAAKAGMLVTLGGVTPEGEYRGAQPKGWDVSTLDGKNVIVGEYLMGSASLKNGMSAGNSYRVDGVLVYAFSENIVAPRNADDIEKECQDGTFLCDSETNAYSVCYGGTWSDQGSCKNFQYSSTSSAHGTVFACNDTNDGCEIKTCEDGYEPTEDGQGCQETTVVSHCVDFNGDVAEPDSWFCKDATTRASCGLDGNVAGEIPCTGEQICNPATINSTFLCENPDTPAECTESVCNGLQYKECKDGKFQAEIACTTDVEHATAICETTGCSFTCDERYTLVDGKCESIDGGCKSDADCKDNADGKTKCDTTTNECIMPDTPAECTESVCNGLQYKECKDGKFQAEIACTTDVEHATAICETTGCSFTCDERYTLVDGKCESIDGGCKSDADCKDNADGKTKCDTKTNTCVAPATPSTECTKDEDCASREDGKNTCDTKTNTCEKAWETIVVADKIDGSNPSCHGVSKSSGKDYLNCGHFAKDFDPSEAYIVYELDASAIASLAGKSQIAADFEVAAQSDTVLTKVNYQFFAGNTALGTVGTVALNKATKVPVEKYSVSVTSTEKLQLRVWPDPSEGASKKAMLRLYSTTIYAR